MNPRTYFTAKYGHPLKTLDHLPQNVDPPHISLAKFGPVTYLGGFQGFWKLLWPVSSAARNLLLSHSQPHATLSICVHCAKFATNAGFERCVAPLRHTHEKQSLI